MTNRSRNMIAAGCGLLLTLAALASHAEVVVVVSARSPVTTLSVSQLEAIFLGRLERLAQGNTVVPVDQVEGRPERDAFYREYLGRSPAEIKAHWSKLIFTGRGRPPQAVADGAAAARAVAMDPKAIGYIDAELVDDDLQVVTIE